MLPLPAFIDTISVNTPNPTRPDYMVRLIVPGESCLLEGRQVIELARQLLQADAECVALDLADAERAKQLAEREDMPHAVILNRSSREWVIDLDSAVRGRLRV